MMRDPDVVFVIGADQEVYPIFPAGQLGNLSGVCRSRRRQVEGPHKDAG